MVVSNPIYKHLINLIATFSVSDEEESGDSFLNPEWQHQIAQGFKCLCKM